MAVRLTDMKAKTRETELVWDGETVAFCYKPNEFTMDLADEIDAAAKSEETNVVATLLGPVLVWWDVLDDKDKRIPPTAEKMGQFPLNFLLKIMRTITEDQDPEPQG
jgi:hypothetical protein